MTVGNGVQPEVGQVPCNSPPTLLADRAKLKRGSSLLALNPDPHTPCVASSDGQHIYLSKSLGNTVKNLLPLPTRQTPPVPITSLAFSASGDPPKGASSMESSTSNVPADGLAKLDRREGARLERASPGAGQGSESGSTAAEALPDARVPPVLAVLEGGEVFVSVLGTKPRGGSDPCGQTLEAHAVLGGVQKTPWRAMAWHPSRRGVLAVMGPAQLAVYIDLHIGLAAGGRAGPAAVAVATEASLNPAAVFPGPAAGEAGGLAPATTSTTCALAWGGPGEDVLAVSWHGVVELFHGGVYPASGRKPCGAPDDVAATLAALGVGGFVTAAAVAAEPLGRPAWPFERRPFLLGGSGGAIRALCPGPRGSIVGTIEARVAVSRISVACGDSSAAGGLDSEPEEADGGLLDLRGRCGGDAPEEGLLSGFLSGFLLADPGVGVRFGVGSGGVNAVEPEEDWAASVCLVLPPLGPEAIEAGLGGTGAGSAVCAFPLPDILAVQGDLALVGSTAAAPMLQIFSISSAGLHLLRVIMLSDGLPDLGSARLAGLALHSRLGSIGISCILARPVAGQQPAGEIFGGQRTFVLHSSQYVLGGCGEKPGNSAVGEGAGEGVIDVGGGLGGLRAEVSELALKVEGLRQHMDARFDRLEELIRRLQSGKG